MARRVIASVIVLFALSAGIAYAAGGRETGVARGEVVRVTHGTFTVPVGGKVGRTLPLTGITVSGTTLESPPELGILLARPLLEAASGKTMDAFVTGNVSPQGGTVGGQSLLAFPVAYENPTEKAYGAVTMIATSNGATATITIGGTADRASRTCTFTLMAVETR